MRNSFRILIWGAVALALVAILITALGDDTGGLNIAGLGFSAAYSYNDSDTYHIGSTTLESAGITRIEVDWVDGPITVHRTDETLIRIEESSDSTIKEGDQLRYRISNGKLTIRFRESSKGMLSFGKSQSKALSLHIPKNAALSSLSIDSVSGTITIDGSGTIISDISVESVSGGVDIYDITAKSLEVETISGQIDIAGAYDKIELDTVSGGGALNLNRMPHRLTSESVSGSIHLTLPENSGFTASLDSVSGRIRCDFVTMDGKKRAALYGDGSTVLKFESVSGNVAIELDETQKADTPPVERSAAPMAEPSPASSGDSIPLSGRSF